MIRHSTTYPTASPSSRTMNLYNQEQNNSSPNESGKLSIVPKVKRAKKPRKNRTKEKDGKSDLSEVEFEAKSSKDGAWYDVDRILAHRYLSSGEVEVHVRFVGFGADEDEWVNLASSVRERSVPLEPYECHHVNVGDILLCFQEKRDQAIYYDVRVLEIERRTHDMRGCRCLFLVRNEHNNSEARKSVVETLMLETRKSALVRRIARHASLANVVQILD